MNSIRFWQVTGAAFFQAVKIYFPELNSLWDIISLWLVTVAGIGTADSIAVKLSSKKEQV